MSHEKKNQTQEGQAFKSRYDQEVFRRQVVADHSGERQ
jgi:hypothetical protein